MNFLNRKVEYDLHLSAISISLSTIQWLQELGFARDEFANNTRCVASEFHGTFRGNRRLPDDDLWNTTCNLLCADDHFVGGLEEEATQPEHEHCLRGSANFFPEFLPSIELQPIGEGRHKACDIHIGITLGACSPEAALYVEHLGVASFEKPTPDGLRRVYTITCETFDDGEILFHNLCDRLDRVQGLRGKLKLERTTRFFRHPCDAAALPLTTSASVKRWLEELANAVPA